MGKDTVIILTLSVKSARKGNIKAAHTIPIPIPVPIPIPYITTTYDKWEVNYFLMNKCATFGEQICMGP